MADVNGAAAMAVDKPGRKPAMRSPKMIVMALIALITIGGGAGGWWFMTRHSPPPVAAATTATAAPFYLELKPFVVSVASDAGTPHFVQLGLSLALPGKDAGDAVSGILPEVEDALRQTVLAFKAEEILTPAGVDRLRQAMIASANRLLLRRLGTAEVMRLNGENQNGGVVRSLYFSTLIVE
jgi:flagellar basal body-associated protein FliL